LKENLKNNTNAYKNNNNNPCGDTFTPGWEPLVLYYRLAAWLSG